MLRVLMLSFLCGGVGACVDAAPTAKPQQAASPLAPTTAPAHAPAAGSNSSPASQGQQGVVPRTHRGLTVVAAVSYVDERCNDRTACLCAGVLRYGENALRSVGVAPEALRTGVPCLIGDYDGNHVADLAVAESWDDARASRVAVLMFDQAGLSATALLPKRVRALGQRKEGDRHVLFEPGPTEKKAYFGLKNDRFEYNRRP